MSLTRRILLALALMAGLSPAFGQAPPPVPALPDTDRVQSYSIVASNCACAVNFALYGDSTDYQNWIDVYVNGVNVQNTDPIFGWIVTSPTGQLGSIPLPITDAVLTFNSSVTGNVTIIGARRPRRVIQFQENRGVAARDLNQALTDIIAQNRETWDLWERTLVFEPGFFPNALPLAALRAGQYLCFAAITGQPTTCASAQGTGTIAAGNGILFSGTNPTTITNNIAAGTGIAITGTNPLSITNNITAGAGISITGSNPLTIALASGSTTWRTAIANDAVLTTDCGKTVQLGTGATGQFTSTLPAVSGFPTGCAVSIVNEDTAFGKKLSGYPSNGQLLSSNILYPGQAVSVKIVNGAWIVTSAPGRYRKGTQLYASNAGDDTNDCINITTPCLHIGTAVLRIYQDIDNQNGEPQVNIACGSYTESVSIQGPMGYTSVMFLVGAAPTTHCVDWHPASNFSLQLGDLAVIEVQNLFFECAGCSGTNFGIFQHQHSIIDILTGIEFGDFGASGSMYTCDSFGQVNWPQAFSISGGAAFVMDIGSLCAMRWANPASIVTISNTPTFNTLVRGNGNASTTMSGLNWTAGTGIASGVRYAFTGGAYIDQSIVTWPSGSTSGVPTATTTPYGGVAK